jgi:serine/threonine protein kinase
VVERFTCLRCRAVYHSGHLRCPLDGARLKPGGAAPLVGTWFAGRYLIEALVGHGAVGCTYRARHLETRSPVALKVPFGELAAAPASRARYAREAAAARRLGEHPHLVPVVDSGVTAEGLPFLVMDFTSGPTLADLLAAGAVAPDRLAPLLAQAQQALEHARGRGVGSRELGQRDIVVSRTRTGDRARVVDLGIGRAAVG